MTIQNENICAQYLGEGTVDNGLLAGNVELCEPGLQRLAGLAYLLHSVSSAVTLLLLL
jgi:hypothetical protein